MTVSRVCYVSREAVKRASSINGPDQDARVDRVIQAESRSMENDTRTWFIPRVETKQVRVFEQVSPYGWLGYRVYFPADLISLTSLTFIVVNVSTTVIASGDYVLERFARPSYESMVVRLSALPAPTTLVDRPADVYANVTGVWAYSSETAVAGTLVGVINDSVTSLVCSDASLIGVGDSLVLGSEQVLVADRSLMDTTATVDQDVDAQMSTQMVHLSTGDGTNVKQGEVVTIDAERMYVNSVSGDDLLVQRSFDGSTIAAHEQNAKVYTDRVLTVVRSQGGTTPTSHADGVPILVYRAPGDVTNAVLAKSIATIQQEQAGYGRVVGTGDGQRPYSGKAVADEWHCAAKFYRRGWTIR